MHTGGVQLYGRPEPLAPPSRQALIGHTFSFFFLSFLGSFRFTFQSFHLALNFQKKPKRANTNVRLLPVRVNITARVMVANFEEGFDQFVPFSQVRTFLLTTDLGLKQTP